MNLIALLPCLTLNHYLFQIVHAMLKNKTVRKKREKNKQIILNLIATVPPNENVNEKKSELISDKKYIY